MMSLPFRSRATALVPYTIASLALLATGLCAQVDTATILVDPLPSVAVSPDSTLKLRVGEAVHFSASVVRGGVATDVPVIWRSSDPAVVAIDARTGVAVSRGSGTARVWAEVDFRPPSRRTAPVETSAPTVASSGEFVRYASAEVEAILGPQLVAGSAANPWSWFDQNAAAHADKLWGTNGAGLKERSHGYYYDAALVQYTNYYRTGDERALERARELADYWYEMSVTEKQKYSGYNPREAALDGLMLRALDGKPEYWGFITAEVNRHYGVWLGPRLGYPELYFGVRDGGYALLYAARLAQVHPDAAVRAEFRQKAVDAATKYYVRLQAPDGGWYWKDGSEPWEQPFMVGLLLEGMVEVHAMTGDPAVERAILKSVDHLWSRYRKDELVPEARGQGAAWRQVGYFNYPDGRVQGETKLSDGWDTNTIREGRQRNSLVVHAFGYAYQLTKDAKYLAWGDEIFSATYGKGSGPGADAFYGLGDYRGKEYNQAYRSAGHYLALRILSDSSR